MHEEYKLSITKIEENPNYEDKKDRIYGYNQDPIETRFIEKNKTTVTLNKEQWVKVQKAIIEVLE